MSQKEENDCNLDDLLQFYTCTEEDIYRQPTDDELKELCLRVKCKVQLNLWNPMVDIRNRVRHKERLKNKTPEEVNQYIVKCVNHYKSKVLYTDEEIQKDRKKEWLQTKKYNLLYLELWEYERQKNLSKQQALEERQNSTMSEKTTDTTERNEWFDVNTESMVLYTEEIASQLNDLSHRLEMLPVDIQQSTNENVFTQGNSSEDNSPQASQPLEALQEYIQQSTEEIVFTQGSRTEDDASPSPDKENQAQNLQYCTEEIVFTQGSEYIQFHQSVPCTSTQEAGNHK